MNLPSALSGEALAQLAEGLRLGDPIAQRQTRAALLGPLLDYAMGRNPDALAAERAAYNALETWFDRCEAQGTLDPRRLTEDVIALVDEALPRGGPPPWPPLASLYRRVLPKLDATDRMACEGLHDAGGDPAKAGDRLGLGPELAAGPLARMRQAALHVAVGLDADLRGALALDPHRDDRDDPVLRAFIEGPAGAWPTDLADLWRDLEAPERRRAYDAAVHLERALEGAEDRASAGQRARLLAYARRDEASQGWSKAPLILGVGFVAIALMLVALMTGPGDPTDAASLPSMTVLRAGEGEMAHLDDLRVDEIPGVVEGDSLAPGEGLLFAYSNPPESPYRHWLIVGRDAKGQLHWYHPSGDAPRGPLGSSSFILKDIRWRPLKRIVYPDLPPGSVEICALFFEGREALAAGRRQLTATGRWPAGHRDCRRVQVLGPS